MKEINITKEINLNNKSTFWEGEKREREGKIKELGEICHNKQVGMINYLFADIEFIEKKLLKSELEKKRQGYKQQDKKKEFKEAILSCDELKMKLVASKLKCFYCKNQVRLFYTKIKDPEQWTLDRIDNDLPHTDENTCVACLKCNLQRRVTNADKFAFTKNLSIVKQD